MPFCCVDKKFVDCQGIILHFSHLHRQSFDTDGSGGDIIPTFQFHCISPVAMRRQTTSSCNAYRWPDNPAIAFGLFANTMADLPSLYAGQGGASAATGVPLRAKDAQYFIILSDNSRSRAVRGIFGHWAEVFLRVPKT